METVVKLTPRFNNCCCCVPLRTACLIIGWFEMVIFGFITLVCVVSLCQSRKVVEDNKPEDFSYQNYVITCMSWMIIGTIGSVFAALLLYGVYKDDSSCVAAWIMYSLLFLVVNICFLIFFTIAQWRFAFNSLVNICVLIYLIMVVTNYYVQMEDDE